jgi:hypothetical protein
MTQSRRRNNLFAVFSAKLNSDPYLIINLFFSGVIILVFIYSGIFSPQKDNYPIVCIHEKLTGEPCASCGLSHSFSLIVRGRITEAYEWNIYGMRIFIFFVAQLLMRVLFSIFYIKYPDTNRQLIIYDIGVSTMLFIVCFLPFIEWIFRFL